METVVILWHVLAVLAVVAVILHLNNRLARFAERERLLWLGWLARSFPAGQNLPPQRWQQLCAQTLTICEKELVNRFQVSHLKIIRPRSFDHLAPDAFLAPLWTLVLASGPDLNLIDAALVGAPPSVVNLNRQNTNLASVAQALRRAQTVTLTWESNRWHFAVS